MSNALAVRNEELDKWDQAEMVRTLKDTVCKGATDSQFRMFVEVCKATGLNPLLKEVYFVPNVGVMAARDGYLRVANEHPAFDGIETRVERDEKTKLPIKAVCTVWRKDRSHPTIAEAYFNEYKKGGNVWNTYPSAMISKVAEVLALKRSFSINGVVSEEEIGFEAPADEPKKTRAEKIADADEVAKAKIAEMQKALPPAVHDAEFVDNTPPADEPPPSDKEVIEFKPMLAAFADIKPKIGAEKYYEILNAHGYLHANKIRPLSKAKDIFKSMLGLHKRNEERRGYIEDFAELRTKMGDAAFIKSLSAQGYTKPEDIEFERLGRVFAEVKTDHTMSL